VAAWRRQGAADGALRVAVVRLPRMSNGTDVEALAAEPGVAVLVTTDVRALAGADLVILPGTRSTVSDLDWLHRRGISQVIQARAQRSASVLGICGGYQMLAAVIDDPIESGRGVVKGLGLLPTRVSFGSDKVLGRPTGAWGGNQVSAYEIHHGVAEIEGEAELFLDGCRRGQVWGTMWHGTWENDSFRRAWLAEIAAGAGSSWRPDPTAPGFAEQRETMINTLADAVEQHADLGLLLAGTRVAARL
jgi:adenosylcobyric acid synthase